jgi:hypothetical protein
MGENKILLWVRLRQAVRAVRRPRYFSYGLSATFIFLHKVGLPGTSDRPTAFPEAGPTPLAAADRRTRWPSSLLALASASNTDPTTFHEA